MKKKFKFKLKNLLPIIFLFAISVLFLRSLLKPGFPETHDGQSHLARLANFHLAVIDRHFPVRWARNLNYKFGYPVFHFNYYTPYILALLPGQLGMSFETGFKAVFIGSLFFGGLFWYLLLRKDFDVLPSLVGGLFYIAAPYQLVNILVRGSVGEIVALGFLPFLFWIVRTFLEKPNRFSFLLTAFSLVFLSLTHNITAMFVTPILLLYATLLAYRKGYLQRLFVLGLAIFVGFGMSMFFWIPALLEKKFTNMDFIGMSHEYIEHFPTFSQLLNSSWGHGFSVPGSNDGFSFELGPFHWLVVVLSILIVLLFRFKGFKKLKLDWLFFLLLFLGSVVFMNESTLPLWKVIPMVRYIQFPWRLLGFTIFSVPFLAAAFSSKLPKIGLGLALGAIIYLAIIAKPGGWFNWDNYFYYEFPFTSSIKGLNMPHWFNSEKNHKIGEGNIFELKGVAKIKELEWRTQRHVYEIDTPYETEIMERTAYFPGWEVKVDGKNVGINYQREDHPGTISFKVPAGKHIIKTVFTENTPARKLGDLLSVASVLTFLLVLIFWKKISFIARLN